MRATSFARQPLVRMTNVNLEPGEAGSLDDLIADDRRGLYMETNRSWSIDSRRLSSSSPPRSRCEIRDGELGRMLRNPSYAGVTPEFWAGLDAVCSQPDVATVERAQLRQGRARAVMRASHGTAPARFRDVQVGVA